MKKIVAVILALALLIPSVCLALEIDLSALTNEELNALAGAVAMEQQSRLQSSGEYLASGTLGEYTIGVKNVAFDKNRKGERIAIVTMDFSHTSDEAEAYYLSVNLTAYQNGIECASDYYTTDDNSMLKIKSGATIEVKDSVVITSDAPIEIEIAQMFSFSSKEKIALTVPVQ